MRKLHWKMLLVFVAIAGAALLFGRADRAAGTTSLRYLAINVGNASPQYFCWEYKLCRAGDVQNLRNYIATWKPDVIMLSEVYRASQLTSTANNGPILPAGYTGVCGQSRDRYSGAPAAYNAGNASHEHECIAWKSSRVSMVSGSAMSAFGRNDAYGQSNCSYDFTGFRANLVLDGAYAVTAVAVHPDASNASCRTEEVSRYWSQLAVGANTIIGGDWNTDLDSELQRPGAFKVNYLRGQHWMLVNHPEEYSAIYALGLVKRKLDHTFSSFGAPCMGCGGAYGTVNLTYSSALGSYDGHPRADNGEGMDHRQILVDVTVP